MKQGKKIKAATKGKKVAKVPVVIQLEALECGAACLTMVMSYYNKWIPLEQTRSDCGVSRDGVSAKNILRAARYYNFKAAGYRLEIDELKQYATFPCIIHWEFNHFIVLCGFKGNKVVVNDPAKGRFEMSMDRFDEGYTGVCLMFEPTEEFEESGSKKSMLKFAKKRLKGSFPIAMLVVLTTIVSSIIGVVNPALSKMFIDDILPGIRPNWVGLFLSLVIAISVIEIISQFIDTYTRFRIDGKMSTVGSSSFMWKVLNLPMDFFSQRMAGDIIMRQGLNTTVVSTLVNTFAPLIIRMVMMVFYFVVMIKNSIILTIVGLLSIVFEFAISRFISKKRVDVTRMMARDSGKLSGATVSGIEMIETIKANGAEDGFFKKWSGYQASVNSYSNKYRYLESYIGIIPAILSAITDTFVTGLGMYLVMTGNFTLGMVMQFEGFMSSFTSPALELVSAGQILTEMRTDMERIEDVMEYPSEEIFELENDENTEYTKLSGSVDIEHVTFGYGRLGEPVIKDFSMHVEKGKSVAFVGASGCGKSTLSKLIAGLYTPWEGSITFDGKRYNEIDKSIFRGSLAVVDQDIILFEDTIANNIRMWDESIEDFEVILAAKDAAIHDDIVARPGGYSYQVNEEGKDFSGGQRQRLEIARVLAQDPTIVILDEATSALDAKTEYDVVEAIRNRGITTIVVAHRLSTIRDCDEIIVLNNGVVVERGTHDELIKNNGYYTELVTNE